MTVSTSHLEVLNFRCQLSLQLCRLSGSFWSDSQSCRLSMTLEHFEHFGFEVCMRILNFIVTGRYTINIPEIFRCSRFSEFDSKRGCHFLPKTGIEFV